MKRRHRNKAIQTQPDEHFVSGPFEVARFGKLTVSRSRLNPKQFEEMKAKMATMLPSVIAEIDALVSSITHRVSCLPADRLLHRAWWEFAAMSLTQSGNDAVQSRALRMIDFTQSIVAAVAPTLPQAKDVNEEEWAALSREIGELFHKITAEYQICKTASLQLSDPHLDMQLEEFRFKAETMWMHVRGKRYHAHEHQALEDLITPHSDELVRLFGIDAPTLVSELDKILLKLTRGAADSMLALKQLDKDSMPILQETLAMPGITGLDDVRAKLWDDPAMVIRRDAVMGEVFGMDLFDVSKITSLPRLLIDELTWEPGEEKDFLADGKYKGWPLRIWPTMKRPFIRIGEIVCCFDMFSLFDNFYRVLQRIIFRIDPEYKNQWNERQKAISEDLPFHYFGKLLPGMQEFRSVYYKSALGSGKPQWNEADGLIIYDDHLLVVEVMGGAFTYTSPATDMKAHLASLRHLLLSPASQGSRFLEYFESAPEVGIFDCNHTEIVKLRRDNFRNVTVVAITLDAFTELAARAQHLKGVGLDVGDKAVWPLSLDDVRVYADLFPKPLQFLHYVEQRMEASKSMLVDVNDEFDHLGLYFAENNYSRYAAELTDGRTSRLSFDGYRSGIDEFYAARINGEDPKLPGQPLLSFLEDILEFLGSSKKKGQSSIASFFLDTSGELRRTISTNIENQLVENVKLRRARPVSFYGETPFTLFCWSKPAPRDAALAIHHTRAVAASNQEDSRLLIELEYDDGEKLVNVHWSHVGYAGLSNEALAKLHSDGQRVRIKRLRQAAATATATGKIGVLSRTFALTNAVCHCSSRGQRCAS